MNVSNETTVILGTVADSAERLPAQEGRRESGIATGHKTK